MVNHLVCWWLPDVCTLMLFLYIYIYVVFVYVFNTGRHLNQGLASYLSHAHIHREIELDGYG